MRRIVNMHLRLISSSAHNPVSVLAGTDTLAGLFKAKILQKLDSVHVLGILFQRSLSPAGEPFWQWAGSFCAGNYNGQSCQLRYNNHSSSARRRSIPTDLYRQPRPL